MGWASFWADISHTRLVTLEESSFTTREAARHETAAVVAAVVPFFSLVSAARGTQAGESSLFGWQSFCRAWPSHLEEKKSAKGYDTPPLRQGDQTSLLKKLAQKCSPTHFLVTINAQLWPVNSPKIWPTFVIFKQLPEVNIRPIWSHWLRPRRGLPRQSQFARVSLFQPSVGFKYCTCIDRPRSIDNVC
jgi:hypothetical protein